MTAQVSVLRRLGHHLGSAWPVFVVFLAQRLLTVAFLAKADGLGRLTARWDAGWYLRLAQGGYVYPSLSADGRVRASNLAYFPLYPWLVRHLGDVGVVSLPVAQVVVSWVGGLLAAWAVFAVGDALYSRWTGVALAALWGTAPASLALTMGYPEGLFTAAAAATLWCLLCRRPVWAGACAVVAGLLRPSAVAVIAMVGVYFLVELGRWWARRRSEPAVFPFHALAGAVLSTLGLGAFMIYVGIRTREVFGYFTVQAQWGQSTAGFADYVRGIEQGLFAGKPGTFIPVTIVVGVGYVLLFCLVLLDRRLGYASVYAAVLLVISLTHVTFQHVYARQLLPAFVLLIPLVRMRVPRGGAILALTLGSVLMSWGSAQFLMTPTAGM